MKSMLGLKKMALLAVILSFIYSNQSCTSMKQNEISSPDGKTKVGFELRDGKPFYRVSYRNSILIRPSSMGFMLKNTIDLDSGFTIKNIEKSSFNETWQPLWGETSEIRNHYNEMTIDLEKQGIRMQVVFRVFNDGVGFRYVFPGQDNLDKFIVMNELTEFNFGEDHKAWWIPADFDSYEKLYKETNISETRHVNTPVTFQTRNHTYISLHEAALVDYPEMTLRTDTGKHIFKTELAPWANGDKARLHTPFETPWRTIQIAESPGGLIESYLILNLNEPCKLDDVSWIFPMKYAGIWWGMHIGLKTWHAGERHGATTREAKRYIDFCAANNIPGLLIEGWNIGWESWLGEAVFDFLTPYDDFDIEEITAYAKEKGVFLIGHHETGGNIPQYEEQLEQAFAFYNELGIPAVKTGYAGKIIPRGENHHGQLLVRHHQQVIDIAAKYHIMIDAHEPIKPTGLRRTYPNFMTREGVRGMEFNAWSDGNPPEHTCILPFTRMLAGPIDYTPGIFDIKFKKYKNSLVKWNGDDRYKNRRVHTTLAKQLALYVVIYSPMQMVADLPENYEGNAAFDFIREVPVNWDATRVLNAKIGDYVTIARKSGDDWYIGSITDENKRELEISLDFLDNNKKYMATVYADSEKTDIETNPEAYQVEMFQADANTKLVLGLSAGGGQAIIIKSFDE